MKSTTGPIPRQDVTAGLLVWALMGLTAGGFIGFRVARLNLIDTLSSDALLLAGGFGISYGAAFLLAGLPIAAAVAACGKPARTRLGEPAVPVLNAGLAAALASFGVLAALQEGAGRWPVATLGGLGCGTGAVLIASRMWRIASGLPRRLTWAAVPPLLMALALAGAGRPSGQHTTAGTSQPPKVTSSAASADGSSSPRTKRRLLLLGVDGLDPGIVATLTQRGDMPRLRALVEGGAHGRLATLEPTFSPIIWTTIATGKMPEKHGVLGFSAYVVAGGTRPVQRFPVYLGVGHAFDLMQRARLARTELVSSTFRRCEALWNILSREGLRVAVLNWWASWPAEPVNGMIVSDRLQRLASRDSAASWGVVYPESATPALLHLVTRRGQLTPAQVESLLGPEAAGSPVRDKIESNIENLVLDAFAAQLTHVRIADRLLSQRAYDFVGVYLNVTDIASHMAGAYSDLFPDRPADARLRQRYGGVLERAYRSVDSAIEALLRHADVDANVIVCSDHGFRWDSRSRFGHGEGAPPGLFVLYGPDARVGAALDALHVRDIAPTILHLLGLPVARDMDGRVTTEALRDSVGPRVVAYVDTYEREGRRPALVPGAPEGRRLEELKALGYIR